MITRQTWKKGIHIGLSTSWRLGNIIFPITLMVTLLQHTPVIGWIVYLFAPIMNWFGLPGDAAIVLVLGNLLNLYASIGAMLTMELTIKEVFILAIMLSFSHGLLVETAIVSQIGVKAWIIVLVRLGLAFGSAFLINIVWAGGEDIAEYGLVPGKQDVMQDWWSIFLHGLETAFIGILQVALIIIPIMVGIQILKDIRALPYLAKALTLFTKILGTSNKTGVTLMAGLAFGLSYGAGVIIQAAKEDKLSKKDLYLVSIFLAICHAIIEDTLLFIPLGINVLPLLFIRLILAIILTAITAKLWIGDR
jgi:hypothetical protein